MKKKFFSLILCAILILSLECTPCVALHEDGMTISASNISAQSGEKVTVELKVSNNPGFNALNFGVVYNTDYLILEGYSNKINDFHLDYNKSFVLDGEKDYTEDGVIVTFDFKVKDTAPEGNYKIQVNFFDACNSKFRPVPATTQNGSITVEHIVTECQHEATTHYNAVASTCKKQGNDEYYICDDCGKIFASDGITELEGIPYRPFGDHKGGTATCRSKAVCTVCGLSYGDYGSHNYTAQIKKAETLKSAGTCKYEAIYYYSCSVCELCEENDLHTFSGEKDSSLHTGETEIRGAKEATCCEDGYTGDIYCKDCNTKIQSGSVIPATGNHMDADGKWETDGNKHWHTCYNGTIFDEAEHSGGNATCKQKAVCKDCGVEYGDYAAHQLTKHDQVKPTFENDGNIEYWTCNECGNYFSDAEGKNEISAEDTVIGKLTIRKLSYLDGEVLIEVPSNAVSDEFEITVDKIVPPPAEVVEKVKDAYGESSEVLAYYEIRMFDESGDRIYSLNNEITVKSILPEKYQTGYVIKINQEDDNGNLVEMQSWREGEYICYKTDWLEKYQ